MKAFIYWLVVALPLSWGLYKAIEKSVPLFSANVVTVPAAPGAGVPPPVVVSTPPPMATPAATP